ncbi:hypothetical protein EG329_011092 [Mollisiaceae sp. DMI_Dod_QoI]|nr:hypothetical protein EG329_011092 [Helotiales sp. DMI_Dod_QoI]
MAYEQRGERDYGGQGQGGGGGGGGNYEGVFIRGRAKRELQSLVALVDVGEDASFELLFVFAKQEKGIGCPGIFQTDGFPSVLNDLFTSLNEAPGTFTKSYADHVTGDIFQKLRLREIEHC